MFGIKRYSDVLEELRIQRDVKAMFGTQLLSVDGNDRIAVLKTGDTVTSKHFDLLHVSPPMSSPDCVSASPLADSAGFVEVDKHTLQHVRYSNVFAAGDIASTPNSKTAVHKTFLMLLAPKFVIAGVMFFPFRLQSQDKFPCLCTIFANLCMADLSLQSMMDMHRVRCLLETEKLF